MKPAELPVSIYSTLWIPIKRFLARLLPDMPFLILLLGAILLASGEAFTYAAAGELMILDLTYYLLLLSFKFDNAASPSNPGNDASVT